MQDPADVMQLPQFILVSELHVGKFAQALALRSLFGEEVLQQSTIKDDNKRGLRMLNRTTLGELFALIHHHPSFVQYTKADFNTLVNKRIVPSLSHLCKELRK